MHAGTLPRPSLRIFLVHSERVLLILGSLAAAFALVSILGRDIYQGLASRDFDRSLQQKGFVTLARTGPFSLRAGDLPFLPAQETLPAEQTREWSPGRIRSYRQSLASPANPIGRLQIPALGLSVMILQGTGESSLNLGAGHIEGTALPGEIGNIGIAGHRDGYFRKLRRIAVGDQLILTTLAGRTVYRVTAMEIVGPRDTRVLAPSGRSTLTLVTCYPFYYVGSAPQRYIVKASTAADGHGPKDPGDMSIGIHPQG